MLRNLSKPSLSPSPPSPDGRSTALPNIDIISQLERRNINGPSGVRAKKKSIIINQTFDSRSINAFSDGMGGFMSKSRKSNRPLLSEVDTTFDIGKLSRNNLDNFFNQEENVIHLNSANTLRPYGIKNLKKLKPRFVKKEIFKTQQIIESIEEELNVWKKEQDLKSLAVSIEQHNLQASPRNEYTNKESFVKPKVYDFSSCLKNCKIQKAAREKYHSFEVGGRNVNLVPDSSRYKIKFGGGQEEVSSSRAVTPNPIHELMKRFNKNK